MKKNFPFCLLLYFIISTIYPVTLYAKSNVMIAAASDMKFALDELKKDFEKTHSNIEIGISMGSSGKFYQQIKNGAPFDIFFSADIELPNQLFAAGIGTNVTPYARGRLALWSTKYKLISIEDLKNPKMKTIAIANPMHAPYGVKSIEALKKAGVYEAIKSKIILGENISQTAQFVETGAADVGIIAQSLLIASSLKGIGFSLIISEELHSPLDQGYILLHKNNLAAVSFINYMKTENAKNILVKYGFQIPGK